MEKRLSWFWTYAGQALFIGHTGSSYPDSREVEACISRSTESACEVFMRQVNPYAKHLIDPNRITKIYNKTIYPPP